MIMSQKPMTPKKPAPLPVPTPPPSFNIQPDRQDDPRYQNLGAKQIRGQVLTHQQKRQAEASVSITAVQGLSEALAEKEDRDERGTSDGYAPLDGGAQVPASNLPIGTGEDDVAAGNHTHTLTMSLPVFTVSGGLVIGSGVLRLPIDGEYLIVGVRATVNTAPVGDDLILDVLKNGTTIFTTTANRPTIADGDNDNGLSAEPDDNEIEAGDYLTVDIAQVGSGTAGSDLVVAIVVDKVVS
jgi:hypothetical protein